MLYNKNAVSRYFLFDLVSPVSRSHVSSWLPAQTKLAAFIHSEHPLEKCLISFSDNFSKQHWERNIGGLIPDISADLLC